MQILITGGTGLIGSLLSKELLAKGHKIRVLSRRVKKIPQIEVFTWDYKRGYLQAGAMDGIEVIVHLAGEGIADSRWTDSRKAALISSRVDSLHFLSQFVTPSLHTLIGGSATGYYGGDTGERLNSVTNRAGSDFLAECTILWEKTEEAFALTHKINLVKIRTGVVFSLGGGALPKLAGPVRAYIGSPLGTGKQWISWIHEQDLVSIFIDAIENPNKQAIINAVSPNPVSNGDLVKAIGKVLNKPVFFPNVPGFILRLLLGEMATVVLGSSKVVSNVSPDNFKFSNLEAALKDLLV